LGLSVQRYKACVHRLEDAFEVAGPDFRGLVLIPEAGHWVPFERLEAFDAALLPVLDG
jgi:pimeloyl-ACP methyl ester carboxylesterase